MDYQDAAAAAQPSSSSTEEVILPVPEQGGDGSRDVSSERTTTPEFDTNLKLDESTKLDPKFSPSAANVEERKDALMKEKYEKADIKKQRSFEKKDWRENRGNKTDTSKNIKYSSSRKPPLTKTKDENIRSDESSTPKLRRQASQDEPLPPEHPPVSRKSSGRGNRFLRSQPAVMDDSSPPATPDIAIHIQSEPICYIPHQYSNESPSFHLVKQVSNEARSEPALSREPSQEKEFTDSKGVNLRKFIVDTLQKPQDRTLLLQLEKELTDFVLSEENEKKFRPMTSYHRMIVHRVSAYFGLDHNVDHTGKAVIVNKTSNTRIPEQKFREHIHEELTEDGKPKKILTRHLPGSDDKDDDDRSDKSDVSGRDDKRSKSLEERQEEYDKARSRIFNQAQAGSVPESLTVDSPISTLKLKSILHASSRQNSGGSDDSGYHWRQERPWSSVDSSGSERPVAPAITKASSFAGTISSNILMRNDSSASSRSSGSLGSIGKLHPGEADRGSSSPHGPPRSLQISPFQYQPTLSTITQVPASALASQFQPASASVPVSPGYPSASSSWGTSIPSSSAPSQCSIPSGVVHTSASLPQPVLFAAPNLESVPPGCIIINPQTGQPFLNVDGTPLVYQGQSILQQPPPPQQQPQTDNSQDYQEIQMQMQMQNLTIIQHPPSQQQQSEGEYVYHQPVPQQQPSQTMMTPGNVPHAVLMKSGQTCSTVATALSAPQSQMPVRNQVPTTPNVPSQQQVLTANYGSQTQLSVTYQPQYKPTTPSQLTPQLNIPGQQPSISQIPQAPTNNSNIHHQHVSGHTPASLHTGAPMLLSSDGHILSHHQPQNIQTVYAQGYPSHSTGVQQQQTHVIYHVAEHQPALQPPLTVLPSGSQTSMQPTPMVTCNVPVPPPPSSRDIVRPTSPNAQPVQSFSTAYVMPQQLMTSNFLNSQRPLGQGGHLVSGIPSPQGSMPSAGMLVPHPVNMPQNILISSGGVRSPHVETPSSAIRGKEMYSPPSILGMPQRVPSPVTSALPQHQVMVRQSANVDKGLRSLRGPRLHRGPRRQERLQHSESLTLRAGLELMPALEVMQICNLSQDLNCQAAMSILEELHKYGAELRWLPVNSSSVAFYTCSQVPKEDPVHNYVILAVFPSPELAQSAAVNLVNRDYAFQVPDKECLSRLGLGT